MISPSARSFVSVLLLTGASLHPGPAAAQTDVDERAVEITRRMLGAIESEWRLRAYDAADRIRAAVNIRGHAPLPVGVTANVAVDRSSRRWRIDAGGDVGPFTLVGDPARTTLHVPGVEQFAHRSGSPLATYRIMTEITEMRGRLDAGYGLLRYLGEETIAGARSHRIEDRPAPGTVTTFWVDAETSLPHRIESGQGGDVDLEIEFRYGDGSRPTEVEVLLRGEREVRTTAALEYGGGGRVRNIHASTRLSDGSSFTSDVRLDWAPGFAAGFFEFTPPGGTTEVGFNQLAAGVVLAAAGKLAALAPLLR